MSPSTKRLVRDYGLTILIAIGIATLTRSHLVESYRIPGNIMEPTLLAGDVILVKKWSVDQVQRGDVVVFQPDRSRSAAVPKESIRRIIGIAGETVEVFDGRISISRGGNLYLPSEVSHFSSLQSHQNNSFLSEKSAFETLPDGIQISILVGQENLTLPKTRVPSGHVLVLSDRRVSSKSRTDIPWALVPLKAIQGIAWKVLISMEQNPEESSQIIPTLRWKRMLKEIH